MKLSTLLTQRQTLLRQARLANLAFAYQTLTKFGRRIARAQLRGGVVLRSAAPELDRYCVTLTALDGSQSVIEEHFSDEELMELGDVVAFINENATIEEMFQLEDFADQLLAPLRAELEREGVAIDEKRASNDALR
jgi:hypothetical protein